MSEPLSATAASSRESSRATDDRAQPVHAPEPSGPTGGYAAISIGRWWQGGKAAGSR
jgi:hypothetical protein